MNPNPLIKFRDIFKFAARLEHGRVVEVLFIYVIGWKHVKHLLRLPAARLTLFVPLAAYLIIYSSEFEHWFDFAKLGEPFLFSADQKLRMIYYGGICVLIANAIFWLACPALAKQYDDQQEIRDSLLGALDPTELSAIATLFYEQVATPGSIDTRKLPADFLASRYYRAVAASDISIYDQVFNAPLPKHDFPGLTDIEKYRPNNDGRSGLESDIDELGHPRVPETWDISNLWKVDSMVRCLGLHGALKGNAAEHALNLYVWRFHQQQAERRRWALLTTVVTVFGLVLFILPALETFIHVLVLDVGSMTRSC